MIDNLLGGGDDDDDPGESDVDDMDGGLFDDGDDLMGDGDDLMGDDDELMGDDMGFDDMDGGGAATSAEVDNRIDELENEVASLSSTVNTVKSENEQISESVGNVEENVRKLLEVYEMVTRGVNPFIDESDMGDGFGSGTIGDGSMGLFGDDEEESEIDSSVADASADEFFDEDLEDGEEDDFDDFDDFDDDGGFDDELEDDFDGGFEDDFDEEFEDDESEDGGKSFEELKAEYDSGEAEWDDEAATDADELDDTETDDPEIGDDNSDFDTSASDPDPNLDDRNDEGDIDATDDDEGDIDAIDDEADSSTVGTDSPIDGGKPYLEALPSGYAADIVVMDWLEFLVEEAGVDGAARTIAYYETIEWIDTVAADALQTFLNGFGGGVEAAPDPQSSLTVEHHNASLRYISRIANPDMGMVAFDERTDRGGPHARSGMGRSGGYAERSFDPSGREPANREVESDGGREIDGSDDPRIMRHCPPDRSEHDERNAGGFDWRDDNVE
ncbi:MAG: FlaD/FlaE family flagellar protein [Natronomonas sp.]|jgi:archaellum component FlaD/FlaE/archaellum component FlaC|nr:FlaD/FlaE family flagellar protein [Natronomonas sp.]